jgi:hypothetical protein
MTSSDRPAFGAREVIAIASKFKPDGEAFIIGGQAVNFWALYFRNKAPEEFKLREPYTSEDIDYFGSKEVARNIAAALGGTLLLPKQDDHTPCTARIVTKFEGKPLTIDFLGAILGINNQELRRSISVVEIKAELDGRPVDLTIKVLHPVQCLKSRIISMLHPATRRTGQIARKQLEAAVIVVRCFIDDALESADGWRDARDCFATLYWYLRSDEYVKVADIALGIDVLEIIRAFADDERIDFRYRELQLKEMIANIERRRAARR